MKLLEVEKPIGLRIELVEEEEIMSLITKHKAWPTVLLVGGLVVIVVSVVFAPPLVRIAAVVGCVASGVGYAWRTIEK
jgi:hypothetical protein